MTRRTITVDGAAFCGDVLGALPGSMTISNAVAGACAVNPPGQDLTALATAQLIYGGDAAQNVINNVDMRHLINIFGRSNPTQALQGYGYRPSLVQSMIAAGRHWRAQIDVPADAPDGAHALRAVSYSLPGHNLPRGWQAHTIRAACVPLGADWSAASVADGSMRTGIAFQDQLVLMFSVGLLPSTGRVELARGRSYDLLLAFDDPTYGGGTVLQWN